MPAQSTDTPTAQELEALARKQCNCRLCFDPEKHPCGMVLSVALPVIRAVIAAALDAAREQERKRIEAACLATNVDIDTRIQYRYCEICEATTEGDDGDPGSPAGHTDDCPLKPTAGGDSHG